MVLIYIFLKFPDIHSDFRIFPIIFWFQDIHSDFIIFLLTPLVSEHPLLFNNIITKIVIIINSI